MSTKISGRGGSRKGAGRPGEDSSNVRISLAAQEQAAELAEKLGVSKRQVIEDSINFYKRNKMQKHDAVHVINQAATGHHWAQSLISQAYDEVYGPGSDQCPDFSEISSQDQDLIDFLNSAWGYDQD